MSKINNITIREWIYGIKFIKISNNICLNISLFFKIFIKRPSVQSSITVTSSFWPKIFLRFWFKFWFIKLNFNRCRWTKLTNCFREVNNKIIFFWKCCIFLTENNSINFFFSINKSNSKFNSKPFYINNRIPFRVKDFTINKSSIIIFRNNRCNPLNFRRDKWIEFTINIKFNNCFKIFVFEEMKFKFVWIIINRFNR